MQRPCLRFFFLSLSAALLVGACGDDKPKNISIPNGYIPGADSTSLGDTSLVSDLSDGGALSADDNTSVRPNPRTDDAQESDASRTSEPSCAECDASSDQATTGEDVDPDEGSTEPPVQNTDGDVPDASTTDEASEKWRQGQPLFSLEGISQIRLEISPEGIDALNADSSTYVPGSFGVVLADGTQIELADVGMRIKGQLGSLRSLDMKAAFLLKMNEFVADQKLLGLNKLALNNMVQDESMIREQVSYALFREMDVPAPRTAYARVTLNGELMGLYATIEVVDNASFLDHWYGDDDGNLYEGAYGSDLESDLIETFDQDRGPELAFSDLYELTTALDSMAEPSTFAADVEPWIDLDEYARFAATELFLAHWDGYAATRNNYFLYRAPGAKWSFIPWGTDQTFGDAGFSIFDGNGRLQGMCAASLVCRQKLGAAYERLFALVEELDLQTRVNELEALITEAAEEDPRKEVDSDTFHTAIAEIREFLSARVPVAQDQLICVDPANVDEDDDGASGCGADCDDSNPARHPGVSETCNFVDDDCNGQIDELDECESCIEYERSGSGDYAFCFGPLTYAEAQADCRDRGGELISIHGQEDQTQIDAIAEDIGLTEWWIGFSDRGTEGEFSWEDGSAVDFIDWNDGEPNDAGENEDCAQLTGWGAWNDINCDQGMAYICQVP